MAKLRSEQAIYNKMQDRARFHRFCEFWTFLASFILVVFYSIFAIYLLFYGKNLGAKMESYLLKIPYLNRLVDLELFADETLRKGYIIFFLMIIVSWFGAVFFRADKFLYSTTFRVVMGVLYFIVGLVVLGAGLYINLDDLSLVSIKDWLSTNDEPQFMWIKSLTMAFALGMNYFFAYWQATDTTRAYQEVALGKAGVKIFYNNRYIKHGNRKDKVKGRVKFHAMTCWNFILTTTVAFLTMIVFGQTVSVVVSVVSVLATTLLGLFTTYSQARRTKDYLIELLRIAADSLGITEELEQDLISSEARNALYAKDGSYRRGSKRIAKYENKEIKRAKKMSKKSRKYDYVDYEEDDYAYSY